MRTSCSSNFLTLFYTTIHIFEKCAIIRAISQNIVKFKDNDIKNVVVGRKKEKEELTNLFYYKKYAQELRNKHIVFIEETGTKR